ncbi:BON domain-containing protein [Nitrogeniibacter mangrovi]|uniref:Osmotically-inducible protein Y n=1 Tax=Nitrogeniibacter mangrovi TaxID=2016596 RepID=A0A6C1B9Z4_9RHOO|nr:BON domain-containing protein [Nitrogeniibacter mangrovi]QID19508.1 BON domain-containing protein [Nitrogeniibacter mangrovi]
MIDRRRAVAALALTAVLAACSATPTRESTGEYIDDSVITTRVKSAFVSDKAVDALDITVETFRGRVQLSGYADTPEQIDRAVELARNVKGVKSVTNDMRLKSTQ